MSAAIDRYPNDEFLARHASGMYWLARYLERAENLARLLEVTLSFTPASQGAQNWQSVVHLHDDLPTFSARYSEANAANIIAFYVRDERHGNSIISALRIAKDNADRLRAIISSEMWIQLHAMMQRMRELSQEALSESQLPSLLAWVRQACETMHGIIEGSLTRDQSWYFYMLGKSVERADQTTRLLDIKYHLLLPSLDAVGSVIDAAQWFTLLRSAGGYHAFRREHPTLIEPSTVAGFLLKDRRFPRSVGCSFKSITEALWRLREEYALNQLDAIYDVHEALRQHHKTKSITDIIQSGLHEYLDDLQRHLIEVTNAISEKCFA